MEQDESTPFKGLLKPEFLDMKLCGFWYFRVFWSFRIIAATRFFPLSSLFRSSGLSQLSGLFLLISLFLMIFFATSKSKFEDRDVIKKSAHTILILV